MWLTGGRRDRRRREGCGCSVAGGVGCWCSCWPEHTAATSKTGASNRARGAQAVTSPVVIGNATLHLGDALEVLPHVGSFDALICDPPYSSGGMVRGDRMGSTRDKYQTNDVIVEHPEFTGDNRDQRGFFAWASLWLMQAMSAAKPGAVAAIFSDWRQLPVVTDALQAGGWVWRGIVPWDKVMARPMPNRFRAQCEFVVWGTNGPRDFNTEGASYHPGILTEKPPTNDNRVHSTQKPVGIMRVLSRIAPMDGIVLDPFMGSGTTGIGAIDEGRRFIGIEKDPAIFAIACERIHQAQRQGNLFEAA
jgi:DNA modification methylase